MLPYTALRVIEFVFIKEKEAPLLAAPSSNLHVIIQGYPYIGRRRKAQLQKIIEQDL
jgi:hypothetical protein